MFPLFSLSLPSTPTRSVSLVSLFVARLATYVPVEVRESAPKTTPPS